MDTAAERVQRDRALTLFRPSLEESGVTRFAAQPRGAPAREKDILVDAWRRMSVDPAVLAEADKTLGIGPDAMLFADEARAAIVTVLAGP